MYDPFNDDYLYAPLCIEEYSNVDQPEQVNVESSSFLIQPPGQGGLCAQHRPPILQQLQQLQQQQFESCPTKETKQEGNNMSPECQFTTGCLAQLDFDSIFNFGNFQQLPPEKQDELAQLLPAPDLCTDNYSNMTYSCSSSATSSSTSLSSDEMVSTPIHPSFFSPVDNPVFWSALDDWQSMLTAGHIAIPDGATTVVNPPPQSSPSPSSLSPVNANFKDEAFEWCWGELSDKEKTHNVAGDSKSITLKDMCSKGLIRENDIIVYKRNFSACKVIVSKTMKVIKCDGASGLTIFLDNQVFEDFETPTALETKILDHHGEVARDKRPNGNAFKSIRLIRNGKDLGRLFDIRKDAFGS